MKIALLGYGKMGKAIETIALDKGHTCPLCIHQDNYHMLTKENLQNCDVAIEFSTPSTAFDNLKYCIDAGVPVVCGTTAWLERKAEIEQYCNEKNGTFLFASNFSLGVNLFDYFLSKLAFTMDNFSDYKVHIEETHHTAKKDAPSGTAISLAETIISQTNYKDWHLNNDTIPSNKASSLPLKSIRTGDVIGEHTVYFTSPIDQIACTHKAFSRDGFAMGALLAANYIANRKGIFTMKDVLGLEE